MTIVSVWLVFARLVATKRTAWTSSVGEYVSTSATRTPSRNTRATPVWGPRNPIQLTDVPVKANVACAPVRSAEHTAALQSRSELACRHLLEKEMDGSVSSPRVTVGGGGR